MKETGPSGIWLLSIAPAVCMFSIAASAGQFSVHLQSSLGPVIDGIVDTASDTFALISWTDSSSSPSFYYPQANQLPIVLQAFETSNARHDVPDAWDGTMAGWAFVLPTGQDLTSIEWNQGPGPTGFPDASFGWGGLRNSSGNVVFFGIDTFPYVPISSSAVGDVPLSQIQITSVPEPSSCTLLAAAIIIFLVGKRS